MSNRRRIDPGPLITSAALYFGPAPEASIPLSWFDGVEKLLITLGRDILGVAVTADRFTSEGPHLLSQVRGDLIAAHQAGEVISLELYSNREAYDDLIDWVAFASADIEYEDVYLGIESLIMDNAAFLLRQAFEISQGLPDIRYGIGYYRNKRLVPEFYAVGYCPGMEYEKDEAERERITAWHDESIGARRYLAGMFRGAYPANILSAKHVEARLDSGIRLIDSRLGVFERLSQDRWLWTLSEQEIPRAEAALRAAGRLIEPK